MAWLRYGKKMQLVCTEAGAFNADVLGLDDTKSIEVEVKKSVADFRADFQKTRKHWIYSHLKEEGSKAVYAPNFFWYLTYAKLGPQCLAVLDELGIQYAGLAVLNMPTTATGQAGHYISVLRRAPRLHGNKPHPKLVRTVQMRMGSELTTLRLALELLKKAEPEQIAAIVSDVTRVSKQFAETPDWEIENAEHVQTGGDRETGGPQADQ
jgi:hypothetical protein